MKFSRVIGKVDPKLVQQAEDKLSQVFLELGTRYNNEHVGTGMGGDPLIFGLMYPVEHVCTLNMPTAATDGKRYYWNPKFVLKQSRIGLRIICGHEAWHAIYMHPQRRGSRLPKLWNIAVDYIVNGTVMDDFRARKMDPKDMFTKHLGKYMTLAQYAELIKNPFAPIKGFEDLRSELYNDARGFATIGWGHLVHRGAVGADPGAEAQFRDGIDAARADVLFANDVGAAVLGVERILDPDLLPKLHARTFDALVSFAFNLGVRALQGSKLLAFTNKGAFIDAAEQFPRWCHAGDAKVRGAFRPFRGPTQHLDARRVVAFQPREQESGSAVVMLQQPRELLGCGRFPKRCLQYFRGRRSVAHESIECDVGSTRPVNRRTQRFLVVCAI